MCYYNTRERETPPKLKGELKMERFEWMDTLMTDWETFEADMATDPFGDANWADRMEG